MKKGFSQLEIIIVVCLIVPFLLIISYWSKVFFDNIGRLKQYYLDRNNILNRVANYEGEEKLVTKNIYLKRVSENTISVEYLIYK